MAAQGERGVIRMRSLMQHKQQAAGRRGEEAGRSDPHSGTDVATGLIAMFDSLL